MLRSFQAALAQPQTVDTRRVIHFDRVSKKRGETLALNDLSFVIHSGEIVCLLGPNGAGKSTSIQHLLGALKPDHGTVQVLGGSPSDNHIRRRIGCTPQDSGFPEHLNSEEILRLIATHYEKPRSIDETIELFGLTPFRRKPTNALSGGQKRCLALACAFVGNPDLVLLDEPTTGLDVDVRRKLWDCVRNYARQGGTVVFTTHYLEEAEELASRILVINRGQIFKEGCVQSIKSSFGLKQVIFHSEDLVEIETQGRIEKDGSRYSVWTRDSDQYVRDLTVQHRFNGLEVRPVKLEDAFVMMLEEGAK